jgi:hypothetical protein
MGPAALNETGEKKGAAGDNPISDRSPDDGWNGIHQAHISAHQRASFGELACIDVLKGPSC